MIENFYFTDRQKQIIFFILQKKVANASFISEIFSVSSKTIRNEIKEINLITKKQFIISNKYGFSINDEFIYLVDNITLHNSKPKEINEIFYIIFSKNKTTIKELSTSLYLSSSTIEKRLKDVDMICKSNGLKIIKKRSSITIDGNETHKRRTYIQLILNQFGNYSFNNSELQVYFPDANLEFIEKTIVKSFDKYDISINTIYKKSILLNLLCVYSFNLFKPDFKIEEYDDKTLQVAIEISSKVFKNNNVKLNLIYLCLIGITNNKYNDFKDFKKEVIKLTEKSFKKFLLSIDVSTFIENYYKHIYDMIIRCKHQNLVHVNESLIISETNMFIYDVATDLSNNINKKFNIKMEKDEITLISMHIGFSIEEYLNQQFLNEEISVYIDVGEYHYTSKYIKKIHSLFDGNIKIFYVLDDSEKNKIDLVVTTRKYKKYFDDTICSISPFFSIEDKYKIENMIEKIKFDKKRQLAANIFSLLLNDNLFYINDQVNTSKDVLSFLTNELKEKRKIKDEILTSIFIREEMTPTCISNKYAIPHTMDFIDEESKIAVFINPNGIIWDNQVVKIVFLSIINKNNVNNVSLIYSYINDFVSNDENFIKLINSKSYKEFKKILFYV